MGTFTSNGKYYQQRGNLYYELPSNQPIPEYDTMKPLPGGATTIPLGSIVDQGQGPQANAAPRESGLPSAMDTKETELRSSLLDVGPAPDKEAIRADKAKQAQTLVDAIRAQFAQTLSEEQVAGDVRNARTRASNVSAGLAGSDFATAAAMDTEGKNRKIIQSIEAERDAKISAILADVDSRADEQYRLEREQYKGEAEAALNQITTFRSKAKEDIATLAKSGVSLNKLKELEPDRYQKLLDQSGLSELEFDSWFAASIPKSEILDTVKAGSKYYIFTRGADGGIQRQTFDLPEEAAGDEYQFTIAPDGTPLIFNKTDGSASIATGFDKGQFAKPPEPKDTSGLSGKQATRVDATVKSFDSHPIVKQYNEVQNKSLSVQGILESGVGGPADLALVYEFMKALDPTSVVRESEYATAAKSGNIFAGAFAKYNGYLKEEGGFLPDNVKQGFKTLIDQKYKVATQQYSNLRNEFGKRVDRITGDADGQDYLTDYGAAAFGDSGGDVEALRAQLQKGEVLVRDRATGDIGAIPESEYSSAKYIKL